MGYFKVYIMDEKVEKRRGIRRRVFYFFFYYLLFSLLDLRVHLSVENICVIGYSIF